MTDETILTENEWEAIRDAGATTPSPDFMAFMAHADADNLVRRKVKDAVLRGGSDAVRSYLNRAGSFTTKLADGDVWGALLDADRENERVLLDMHSPEYLIEAGVAAGKDFDFAARMVSEVAERANE